MAEQADKHREDAQPSRWAGLNLIVGAVLAAGTYVACHWWGGLDHSASAAAAVTALCATWWCNEAIPIPATSLIPFAAFPLLGVLNHAQLASAYGDKFVLLFMGGFMLSRAAEKSQTHLRLAHGVLRLVGDDSPRRIVLAFLLSTAFVSMWISNTAATLIMLPVVLAVLASQPRDEQFAISLLLAIAYGASVGGMATLVGTPPNGIFASIYEKTTGRGVPFAQWLTIGGTTAMLLLVATAAVLLVPLQNRRIAASVSGIPPLGAWTKAQQRTLLVLATTALAWISRTSPYGGWTAWLEMPWAEDATVALVAVVACFLIPSGGRDATGRTTGQRLLDWETARHIPWGILLLFGGGIAIAEAFQQTGLAAQLGTALNTLEAMPPILMTASLCLMVTLASEVSSNTAIATLLMPILAAAADGAGVDPAVYMVPAALAASSGFMLPIATPPNTIVFGAERMTVGQMIRRGVWIDLAGVVIITLLCQWLIDPQRGLGQ